MRGRIIGSYPERTFMAIYPQPQEPQPEPGVRIALRAMGLTSDDLRAAARAGHDEAARVHSK